MFALNWMAKMFGSFVMEKLECYSMREKVQKRVSYLTGNLTWLGTGTG
jgi:hypothetical protein